MRPTLLARVPRDRLITLCTFVLSALLGLGLLGSLNQQFAQRQLRLQGEALLHEFQASLRQAGQELLALDPAEARACEGGLSLSLARRTFSNAGVRWMAIAREGELLCRSHVVGVPWNGAKRVHKVDAQWSLIALEPGEGRYGLFLSREQQGLQYLAALEPPNLDAVGEAGCAQCRRFSLKIQGTPPLQLQGGGLRGSSSLSHEIQGQEGELGMVLTLQADARFAEHYRLQGWLASLLIATLVAAALALGMHKLLKSRSSLDFLLREGLRRNAFVPFYQPIVDSRDGRILGAEALIRWRRADGSFVPPGQFIPYAEDSGLILPITEQLTRQVIKDVARFGWAGTDQFVSINLVPEQLDSPSYGQSLSQLIAEQGLQSRNVSVEITERRQFHDLVKGRQMLSLLVQAGIEIKLDDAGTGFGGFSYVQELPIGTLKIDKMFVDTLRSGSDAKRPVLDAIVQFARQSGLQTIAEGVETEDQVRKLAAMGVYAIQGYVYGRPQSAEDFMRWMADR